jgi:hypothetical protein
VMRALISCRAAVVSIRSWMEMSAVIRGIVVARLLAVFPGAGSCLPSFGIKCFV